jgi:hypothetical protein
MRSQLSCWEAFACQSGTVNTLGCAKKRMARSPLLVVASPAHERASSIKAQHDSQNIGDDNLNLCYFVSDNCSCH